MQQRSDQPEPQAGAATPRLRFARQLRHLVLGLGAFAMVSVLGGTTLSLWRMRADVIQQAENHLLGLSQILGVQTLRSTHAIDTILHAAAEDAQRAVQHGRIIGSQALHRHLGDTIASTPYVRALMLTDANGRLVLHTGQFPSQPLDFSSLEFFAAHRDAATRRLSISAPAIGWLGSQLSIPISRRIDDAFGNMLGIIVADVDPAYFLWSQSLQELGTSGVVRLLRRDGILLTGYPPRIAAAMKDYRETPYFVQGVNAGRTLIHHTGAVMPGERVSAIYPVEEYPLVITVTTAADFILQSWKQSAWLFGGIAALTAMFLGLITLWLAHQLRVDERLQSVVMESEERLHAIIQSAMDAIITLDENQRIVLFNAAAEQIFCCSSAEALGAGIDRFIPGQLIAPQPAQSAGLGASGTPMHRIGQHLALTGVRAGGAEFPLDASVSQVRIHGAGLFIVILRDITERNQIEAALRQNEQRYRTLFSQSMDGILQMNQYG